MSSLVWAAHKPRPPPPPPPPPPTVIVLDASNSMNAAIGGKAKLDIARQVLQQLLAAWKPEAPLGLIAYGHRRVSDCDDIEVLAQIGPLDPPALTSLTGRLDKLKARGKTPLSTSIGRAADLVTAAGAGGTIILITDGVETCHADPCAVAAALKKAHAALTINVIGFAVDKKDEEQLACIAKASGGTYSTAGDAATLRSSVGEAAGVAVADTLPATPPPPKVEPPAPPPPPAPQIVQVAFRAVIAAEGPLVDHPVTWRITGTGKTEFSYAGDSRGLSLELSIGSYTAEATASNAAGRTGFTVTGAPAQTVDVTIAAGRLAAHAVPYAGAPPIGDDQGLAWTLEPLDGQKPVDVPALAKPVWLLAPGKYRLTAIQGTQRGTADVTIAPGAPRDVEISFRLGQLKLSAAIAADAEPLTQWQGLAWRVLTRDGAEAAKIANEAQPTLSLPAGSYKVELAIAGATLSHDVTVNEASLKDDRFIVPTGTRILTAALAPGVEPFSDWRDASWTTTPIDAVGLPAGVATTENLAASTPEMALMPGRWRIEVKSGFAVASREIAVAPKSTETIRLDLGAARLAVAAEPGVANGPSATNIVFQLFPLNADGSLGEPLGLGGARHDVSAIVPAGKYRAVATDNENRTASRDIELAIGAEQAILLQLN